MNFKNEWATSRSRVSDALHQWDLSEIPTVKELEKEKGGDVSSPSAERRNTEPVIRVEPQVQQTQTSVALRELQPLVRDIGTLNSAMFSSSLKPPVSIKHEAKCRQTDRMPSVVTCNHYDP